MSNSKDEVERIDWLEAELADTIDEDYELELSEPALSAKMPRRFPVKRVSSGASPAWTTPARSWRCRRS